MRERKDRIGKPNLIFTIILASTLAIGGAIQIEIALASPAATIPYVPSNLSKVVVDGSIGKDEYGGSYIDLWPALPAIYWEHDGSNMRIGLVCLGTGWCSIGFGKRGAGMDGANLIIGYVDDKGVFHIRDHFGIGLNHTSDTSLGGRDDIVAAAGSEIDGKTTVEFVFPLNSGDTYDQAFEMSGTYGFFIAFSKFADDFTTFHGATRSGILDLHIEAMPPIKLPTSLDLYLPEKAIENSSTRIVATLEDGNGVPVEGATIDFYMRTSAGWLELGSNTTNPSGVATLNFTPPYAGTIDIMVAYAGALKFEASDNSSSLSVEYLSTPSPPFTLLTIPPALTVAQIIVGIFVTGVAGTLGYAVYTVHRVEHISLPTVPLFRTSISALLIILTTITIFMWTLDPIPIKNQQISGFSLAAEFVMFSMLIYLYRVSRGLTVEDTEWLALGIGVIIALLLFAFFL